MSTAKKLSIRLEAVGGDKVRQEFKSLGTDGTKAFQRITQVITPANDNLKALDTTARAFNNVLKQAVSLAGAYLGFRGLTSIFRSIVSTNRQFEQLSGSLKTVTGSAEAAKFAFEMIENFASSTPYQLEEIVDAFIRLKAMGLEPSQEALTSYGNTASAFGKNILDFVGAVASATVGEFERLKTFGIKAQVEGDRVRFIFQGITTEVGKNAGEIENYLRNLGTANFSGAMTEQMKTINGVASNIADNLSKLARNIGSSGLNDAITSVLSKFNNMVSRGDNIAKSIGRNLASAVNIASLAFSKLAQHADILGATLLARFGSAAVLSGFSALSVAVKSLNLAFINVLGASRSAIAGISMMSQVSKLAAVQMGATAVAAGILKSALALIGGPAGLAILTGTAIYKLVDSHDVAKRAANDHAETLRKLQDELKKTTQAAVQMSEDMSKNEALANWGYKLKIAQKNVRDLTDEIKQTGGLSFVFRNTPNILLKEYEVFAKDNADVLKKSRIDFEEYQKRVWEFAAQYPDFKPQADKIQEKLLLLKAAEQDLRTAQTEISYLENPELKPKPKINTTVTQTIQEVIKKPKKQNKKEGLSDYEKNLEDIKAKIFELQTPYNQAIAKADEWRDNALKNLDSTKAGYEDYKNQVELVYVDMVKKADEAAFQSSKAWDDGIKRGLQTVYSEVSNSGEMAENLVKNSFKSMEDSLTNFVMTGKANIADFANSVVAEMVKISMQYAVIKPLMSGAMSYFGISMAHCGGVIGTDSLSSKSVGINVFSGAQKYHTGGLVGNEIPIIAQRGEAVFTKGQMEALGIELNGKTPVYVNVNVLNKAEGVEATTQTSRDNQGNMNLSIIVEQIEGTIGRNIGRGEGLAPLLEQRYALNPALGSYR